MGQYADYHRTVIGYHGTTRAMAERIVTGGPFAPSENDYDWLGHGIYFWEYAPKQALRWAKQRYGEQQEVAVLAAMIRLGNCFDLLDPDNVDPLLQAKDLMSSSLSPVPRNHNARKFLDCAAFEFLYQVRRDAADEIDTARAVYVPTDSRQRLWERSWLYRQTHIQLCVRNPKIILGVWMLRRAES